MLSRAAAGIRGSTLVREHSYKDFALLPVGSDALGLVIFPSISEGKVT